MFPFGKESEIKMLVYLESISTIDFVKMAKILEQFPPRLDLQIKDPAIIFRHISWCGCTHCNKQLFLDVELKIRYVPFPTHRN